jgi:hypothetical protein
MKNRFFKISTLMVASFLLLLAFSSTSCKKDKTTHGKIHVIDDQSKFIKAASVRLSAPDGQVTFTGTTDAGGYVQFDVKLPAIFDVTASKDTLVGTGILRLDEPGKTTELTVTIR